MKVREIDKRFGRAWTGLFLLCTILGAVLCFVPLFDIVGYESAAVFGVLLGLTVPFLRPPSLDLRGWIAQLGRNLLLLVPPFALLTLNALRVRNCAPGVGVAFWLTIPVMSIVVGQTIGYVVRVLVGRPWRQNLLIAGILLASVIEFGLRLALEPPIVGFNPFLGFFSGSIYDEALQLPESLVWYRGIHLVAVCATLTAVETLRSKGRDRLVLGVVAAVLVVLAAGLWLNRHTWGIDLDRDYIAEKLGGRIESEHFVIYYPLREPYVSDIGRIVEDHEFRYAEMQEYFGTDPVALHGEKVRSFVYSSRDEKGRLMGARRTLVAKIWLREIHILWRFYGDHLLAHELAHVFTEPFGTGPLRLSNAYGLFPNMGLVEGIATAADWHAEELTPHEASAALRRLNKAPDIRRMLGASGFWTQSSGRAYTLMGSFVRYLVSTYGIEPFKLAYGRGNFEKAYGKSSDELVREWQAFVDAIELSEDEIERARYEYDRPSIFQKVCARTIGELRVQARVASRRGNRAETRAIYEAIIGFAPGHVGYRLEYVQFLIRIEAFEEASRILNELLEGELTPMEKAQVLELLGDVNWHHGQADEASRIYTECLELGLPLGTERLVEVKRLSSRDLDARELAYGYILEHARDDIAMFYPVEWVRQAPHSGLANYLVGRRLLQAEEFARAREFLERARGELHSEVLELENELMLTKTYYFLGDLGRAEQSARGLLASQRSHYTLIADEWLRRVDWKRRNTVDPG